MKGLEPSRREAHAPKACVSTNSTTSAYSIVKDTPACLLMTHITHAVTTSMQLTAKGVLLFTNGLRCLCRHRIRALPNYIKAKCTYQLSALMLKLNQ